MNKPNIPIIDGCEVEVTSEFSSNACKTIYNYWSNLCTLSPEFGPQYQNFVLTDFIELVPNLNYKEMVDGGADYRSRYWGTTVSKAFDQERTGHTYRDDYDGQILEQLLALANFTMSDIHAVRVCGRLEFVENREFTEFEAANMPLFDSHGVPSRMITLYDFKTS